MKTEPEAFRFCWATLKATNKLGFKVLNRSGRLCSRSGLDHKQKVHVVRKGCANIRLVTELADSRRKVHAMQVAADPGQGTGPQAMAQLGTFLFSIFRHQASGHSRAMPAPAAQCLFLSSQNRQQQIEQNSHVTLLLDQKETIGY